MSDTPNSRRRDKLKAVFRDRLDRSNSLTPVQEAATQSTSQPSRPQEDRRSDSERQDTAPNPTATLDTSINTSDDNDVTEKSRASAQDDLWEHALSKLEGSTSTEDRKHACALREFAKVRDTSATTQDESNASEGDNLIEKVKRAANSLCTESEQKAWKIDVGARTVVLRNVVSRIIDCLNKFKDIGDLAVQYDPVHAALPWAAFRFLLQAATLNKEQTGQLLAVKETEIQVEKNALSCKAILDTATQQRQGAQYDKLTRILARLVKIISDEEVHRILSWISAIPYETDLHNARRGRLEGTCEWLIAHGIYEQWKASSRSTTLWLHGIRPERINQCAVDAYNRKKERSFASNKLTNEESRNLLLELTNGTPRSTILIDGLDECDEKSRKYILDTLDRLVQHSSSVVKVFVASRNDKDLTQHYNSSPNLEIEAAHNQDDIEKLILDRIASSQWAANEMSVQVRDAVVRLFQEKSQGMFQWASLHIDELLEFESDQAIMDWLHSLPEGLKAAYDRIYDGLGPRWHIYADRAFMWLMVTTETISLEMLCILVCQDPSKKFDYDAKLSPRSLLSACRNLIKADAPDYYGSKCRFAHLSVQEYLETHHLNLVTAERMFLEVSVRFWQFASATGYQKKQNDKTSKAEHTSTSKQAITHKQLQLLTERPIRNFFKSADMSTVNQNIWDQLLRTTRGYDVVRGNPCWRAFNHATTIFDSIHREDELRAFGSPIGTCAWFDNQAPIKHWIENGSFNPVVDRETARDLLFATYIYQRPAACSLLLNAGTNFAGETSHMLATRMRDLFRPMRALRQELHSMLIRLLQQLFDDGAPTTFSPSNWQLYYGTYPAAVARTLLENGVDLHAYDVLMRTPLMHAVMRGDGNIETTKLLLQYGAEVNSMDQNNETPLHLATRPVKNFDTLQLLLDHGANPNVGATRQGTPLQHVAFHLNIDAVKLLLECNAQVDTVSCLYGTALHAAALRGSRGKEIYDLLLAHGADPSIKCRLASHFCPREEASAEEILKWSLMEEEDDWKTDGSGAQQSDLTLTQEDNLPQYYAANFGERPPAEKPQRRGTRHEINCCWPMLYFGSDTRRSERIGPTSVPRTSGRYSGGPSKSFGGGSFETGSQHFRGLSERRIFSFGQPEDYAGG
ncbi:hypothetical protein G7054_g3585 [Neopestalotiopsis clavispora]|nr:hypothetical protein G7054_g3585 [Neopestalotiopsis clavispora]